MVPDFSGYATKADIKCSDGRTITKDAFAHHDGNKVPLVWAHDHDNPENVLGYAILSKREDGIWCDGYFNETPRGLAAKMQVAHGDLDSLSIWANQLVEKSKSVVHGMIREVSLVLAGANPGAKIQPVGIRHSDGDIEDLDDVAIITTGEFLSHGDSGTATLEKDETVEASTETLQDVYDSLNDKQKDALDVVVARSVAEVLGQEFDVDDLELRHAATAEDTETLQDVYNTFSEKQKDVLNYIVEKSVETALAEADIKHSDVNNDDEDKTGEADAEAKAETDESMDGDKDESTDEADANVVDESTGTEPEADADDSNDKDDSSDTTEDSLTHQEGNNMNVFDGNETGGGNPTNGTKKLTHDQIKTVLADVPKFNGSFRESLLAHAEEYGVENIDFLFPDAKNLTNSPEWISRRMEWVGSVLGGVRKAPFSRVKSVVADITAEEARAKGYVKGTKKKDEVIKLLKRVTTAKTIYKKQRLDRDDILEITELDVVVWLKAEMRLMLDEELARAILVGDGREPDDEDKIDEDHIRPVAFDDDMYAHKVTLASNITPSEIVENILRSRKHYKGTGTPTLYTTDDLLTDLILIEDKTGRRKYETEAALAAALRVKDIVVVEVMDDNPDILAILVNLADYTVGTDRGGEISMFDDFDIDYNQQKYLIETRVSGALTKPKSALVIRKELGTTVTPVQPQYNSGTKVITIPSTTGVDYKINGVTKTAGALPAITEDTTVESFPKTGYQFPHNTNTDWFYAV